MVSDRHIMIFAEKKLGNTGAYNYECVDIFGTLIIDAEFKITPGTLDDLSEYLIHLKSPGELLTGSVKTTEGTVTYQLTKTPTWGLNPGEKSDKQSCEKGSITSTKETANESAPLTIGTILTQTIKRLWRYVEALVAAWKNSA